MQARTVGEHSWRPADLPQPLQLFSKRQTPSSKFPLTFARLRTFLALATETQTSIKSPGLLSAQRNRGMETGGEDLNWPLKVIEDP